jgi:hypothetical protein
VTVKAIPAIRLFDDGDVLDVDARGITIPIEDPKGGSFKEPRLRRGEGAAPAVGGRAVHREPRAARADEGEENSFTYRGALRRAVVDFALGAPPTLRTLIEAIAYRLNTAIPDPPRRRAEEFQGGRADRERRGSGRGRPLGGIAPPARGAIIGRLTGQGWL